jgi:hypothetical protein
LKKLSPLIKLFQLKKTIINQKTHMNTTISSANLQVNPEHVIAATVAPSALVETSW